MLFTSTSSLALLGASLISLVTANPIAQDRDSYSWNRPRVPQGPSLSGISLPRSDLPAPRAGLVLKTIALGIGTQNYTCNLADPSKPPVPIGAVAELHNAESVAWNEYAIKGMTIAAFYNNGRTELPSYGKHYFVEGKPIFDLGERGVFRPERRAGFPAPANSVPQADKAVDWLKLEDSAASTEIYRVFTNGGKAPADCKGQKKDHLEVKYTTNYFFFGPA